MTKVLDSLTKPLTDAVDVLKDKKTYKSDKLTDLETVDRKRKPAQNVKEYSGDVMHISGNVPKKEEPFVGPPEPTPFEGPPEPTILQGLTRDMKELGSNIGEGIGDMAEGAGQALESGIEGLKNITDEYPNFWIGAAPMIMGAVLKDLGEGARAGSEGLIQRYKDERDAGIAARKAASDASGGAMKSIYDQEKGLSVYGHPKAGDVVGSATKDRVFKTQERLAKNQQMLDRWKQKRGHIEYKTNQSTGELFSINKLTGGKRRLFNPTSLPPKARADAKTSVEAFNSKTEPMVNSMYDMQTAFKNITDEGSFGKKMGVMGFVKTIETKLSDQDRDFYINNKAIFTKIGNFFERHADGEDIPKEVVKESLVLASRGAASLNKKYKNARDSRVSQFKARWGKTLSDEQANSAFGDVPDTSMMVPVISPKGEAMMLDLSEVSEAIDNKWTLNYKALGVK